MREPALPQPMATLAGEQAVAQQFLKHPESARLFAVVARMVLKDVAHAIRVRHQDEVGGPHGEAHHVAVFPHLGLQEVERVLSQGTEMSDQRGSW
ncbi:hypothetical protein MVI01_45560 [Myxococcus virescens]|uniref:Uncharacterized protein n=1 Tax=Myxococcus virescens TaxID=83456 RepID=A0A511HGS8_9BACT|nr:hypothetical protein MVI01_45560 [Myxococcus virescens]